MEYRPRARTTREPLPCVLRPVLVLVLVQLVLLVLLVLVLLPLLLLVLPLPLLCGKFLLPRTANHRKALSLLLPSDSPRPVSCCFQLPLRDGPGLPLLELRPAHTARPEPAGLVPMLVCLAHTVLSVLSVLSVLVWQCARVRRGAAALSCMDMSNPCPTHVWG